MTTGCAVKAETEDGLSLSRRPAVLPRRLLGLRPHLEHGQPGAHRVLPADRPRLPANRRGPRRRAARGRVVGQETAEASTVRAAERPHVSLVTQDAQVSGLGYMPSKWCQGVLTPFFSVAQWVLCRIHARCEIIPFCACPYSDIY